MEDSPDARVEIKYLQSGFLARRLEIFRSMKILGSMAFSSGYLIIWLALVTTNGRWVQIVWNILWKKNKKTFLGFNKNLSLNIFQYLFFHHLLKKAFENHKMMFFYFYLYWKYEK